MSSSCSPAFVYLEADFPPVFAAFHASARPHAGRAVLLCPPFGWEDMCSYRSRRDWAERLARAGFPALRLDLPGSGDSAGGPADAGQLNTWTRAVSGAARWLTDRSGAERVVAVGIGLGGMVACRAALEGAPLDELVLWNVPARGRTIVRELRAFSALEVAYTADAARAHVQPAALEDGALVANGYLMSAETVSELGELDLAQLAQASRGPRRALLLGRDGLKVDERLRDALERRGSAVAVADGPDYAAMTVEPQDARPPLRVFELVDSWLRAEDRAQDRQAPDGRRGQDGAHHPRSPASAVPASAVSVHEELELTCTGGVELRERPLVVDTPDGALFGILTEPLGERRELSAVLINAGAQRRTGPNRMWVEIARRWAARGVPTLRFDLAGIGDSDGDAAELAHVAAIYAQTYGRQARAALDTLTARGLPRRALVLGLCAGGYWSLHTALADERVGTVVMLNPRSLIWDEGIYAMRRARELRGRLLLGSTWHKALRGELNFTRHLETARALAGRAVPSSRRTHYRIGGSSPEVIDRTTALAGIFDTLRDRGQLALLLFTGSEPLRAELAARGLLARAERWPNLEIAIRGTSADTHTLTPLWLQREVHELIDGALERELGRTVDAEERIA